MISAITVAAFCTVMGYEAGSRARLKEACKYLHSTDRGAELVCRETPPWKDSSTKQLR